jgi:hypothetical protein
MKQITVSLLALIMLSSLTSEVMACKGKDGDHKGKFFTYMDTNTDGKVTKTEMTDNALKMFKEHDTNYDPGRERRNRTKRV